MNMINENMSVAEIVRSCPNARRIFDRHGLKGCGGEHGPSESLSFFATVHQANVDELIREINCEINNPSAQPYIYKETLPEYIHRRFFKAGVLTVLTVGCLWGAVNLSIRRIGKDRWTQRDHS
jgi:iron-sulfur cluster repair protein YtfE (RIC family)